MPHHFLVIGVEDLNSRGGGGCLIIVSIQKFSKILWDGVVVEACLIIFSVNPGPFL